MADTWTQSFPFAGWNVGGKRKSEGSVSRWKGGSGGSSGNSNSNSTIDFDKWLSGISSSHPLYGTLSSFFGTLKGWKPGDPTPNSSQWGFKPNALDHAPQTPAPSPGYAANNPWLAILPSREWMLQPTSPQNPQQAGMNGEFFMPYGANNQLGQTQ